MKDILSLEDIYFEVKILTNGKSTNIEGYKVEILKIARHVLIPHIHKLFNLVVKKGFPTLWSQSLIIPIFKSGDKTIMISPLLAKLYVIILENNIDEWLEMEGKRAKGQARFRRNHSTTDHIITLRIIA